MLSVTKKTAECRYAECRHVECSGATIFACHVHVHVLFSSLHLVVGIRRNLSMFNISL